jgi:hypothetical protein
MDFDDNRDFMDQDIPAGQFPTVNPGPIHQFLSGIPDWLNFNLEDLNRALESLPIPLKGPIPQGISLQEAIEVKQWHNIHIRQHQTIILHNPPDAADVITGSEHILKAYANKHSLTATAIVEYNVDLIKNLLKNPEFDADNDDTDMLQRLQAVIDSGNLQVIIMHKDGDGPQILELFAMHAEKVLRELIGDLRLASHQHFAFNEYKDPYGNRLFAGDE